MKKIDYSYKSISEDIKDAVTEDSYLNKQAILNRLIEDLPQIAWANIEILDWSANDNKLPIKYYFYETSFGKVLAANTTKGACYLGLLGEKPEDVLIDFKKRFSYTEPIEAKTPLQKQMVDFLDGRINKLLIFHLKGTPYQTEIWRRLIRIPYGKVISYATIGGSSRYSRAAGTANGRNPIFWIIPCHRVVKTSGGFDRYFWGEDVKKRLLAWEFVNS